jgi:DNA mismatch repair ATPase MutS
MGGRLLSYTTLKDGNKMQIRHEVVSIYKKTPGSVAKAKQIKQISDLRRLISKLHGKVSPHEVV